MNVVQTINLSINGTGVIAKEGKAFVLTSADPADTNSAEMPTKVVPVESDVAEMGKHFSRKLPPYSVTVLVLKRAR